MIVLMVCLFLNAVVQNSGNPACVASENRKTALISKRKFMIPENAFRVHPWNPQELAEIT